MRSVYALLSSLDSTSVYAKRIEMSASIPSSDLHQSQRLEGRMSLA